uniref:Solute carrier family 2 member 11, like n=1 Tax=Xiphophorus couchianus TaxID=32473 RepID=A0A3B5L6F2_9TELE
VWCVYLQLNYPVLIAAIFICSIGGTFQYGFSVSVMTSPSQFIKDLVNKSCVERYDRILMDWEVSLIWSFTVSIFCFGGLLGSLVASSISSRFGRKRCLLVNNFWAILGAILMISTRTANSFEMIMVGRFLYGINSGVGLSAQTMYLTESSPKNLRAMVGVTIATALAIGKFCGQLLGIRELLGTEKSWPWLLGFNGFIALFQFCTLPLLPESPRFLLLERGDLQASENAFRKLWGKKDYSKEVVEMLEEKAALQSIRSCSVLELIQNRTVRWQVLTIVIVFFALQFSGINAVYFYSFDVFRAAGIQEHRLAYAALGTGLCELTTSIGCVSPPSLIFTYYLLTFHTCKLIYHFKCFQENLGNFCFLIFLAVCLICGFHVRFNVPETKARTALEVSAEFDRMHAKDKTSQKKNSSKICEIKAQETKL